ncbi:hypothetical protein D3C87_677800 [compost metagenome]
MAIATGPLCFIKLWRISYGAVNQSNSRQNKHNAADVNWNSDWVFGFYVGFCPNRLAWTTWRRSLVWIDG